MRVHSLRSVIGPWATFFCFIALWVCVSCSHQPAAKRYELQGRVVAVDAASRELTIAHGEIPGVMEAMTMPYLVSKSDEWVFRSIAPGDQVHATLVVSDHAELQDVSFSKVGESTGGPGSQLHIPQPGEQVPDLTLTNQNDRTIHFSQFAGKPLLLTFIYTRCPFPDYCPRLSSNFAQVLEDLQKNPAAFRAAQLLSISIDPEHDRPAELRRYGERYAGRLDPGFQHWQFASGSPAQVRRAANFFGLAYDTKDGQIVHGLSTVLIGKDGKVLKVYSGNAWKPDEVAADVAAAAG
ncbi:MAG TPA: SCO family protein [Candidatus Binatia bacterium]|nr:SCO family protein [Candidatus Binatia bacterium]